MLRNKLLFILGLVWVKVNGEIIIPKGYQKSDPDVMSRFRTNSLVEKCSFSYDAVAVVDTTYSQAPFLEATKTKLTELFDYITGHSEESRFALTTFADKKLAPLGHEHKEYGDRCFTIRSGFVRDKKLIQSSIDRLHASGGFDFPESQLEGLMRVTLSEKLFGAEGLKITNRKTVRIVFLITDSFYHQVYDLLRALRVRTETSYESTGIRIDFPYEFFQQDLIREGMKKSGLDDFGCQNYDYPEESLIGTNYKNLEIFPVFLVHPAGASCPRNPKKLCWVPEMGVVADATGDDAYRRPILSMKKMYKSLLGRMGVPGLVLTISDDLEKMKAQIEKSIAALEKVPENCIKYNRELQENTDNFPNLAETRDNGSTELTTVLPPASVTTEGGSPDRREFNQTTAAVGNTTAESTTTSAVTTSSTVTEAPVTDTTTESTTTSAVTTSSIVTEAPVTDTTTEFTTTSTVTTSSLVTEAPVTDTTTESTTTSTVTTSSIVTEAPVTDTTTESTTTSTVTTSSTVTEAPVTDTTTESTTTSTVTTSSIVTEAPVTDTTTESTTTSTVTTSSTVTEAPVTDTTTEVTTTFTVTTASTVTGAPVTNTTTESTTTSTVTTSSIVTEAPVTDTTTESTTTSTVTTSSIVTEAPVTDTTTESTTTSTVTTSSTVTEAPVSYSSTENTTAKVITVPLNSIKVPTSAAPKDSIRNGIGKRRPNKDITTKPLSNTITEEHESELSTTEAVSEKTEDEPVKDSDCGCPQCCQGGVHVGVLVDVKVDGNKKNNVSVFHSTNK